jgi:hypothetical protein
MTKFFESGSMPGVGPIHIDEIKPTLAKLEKSLGMDLQGWTLGSVGKKEFSGDIDIAVQINTPEEFKELEKKVAASPLVIDQEPKGGLLLTTTMIVGYDPKKQSDDPSHGPRTGKVQIDFMPGGNPQWLRTYYHSPSREESKYKGVFRNILISTIAAMYGRESSEEKIDDGRPMSVKRWKWGNNGLLRVERTPKPKASGEGYTKANIDKVIGEPITDGNEVAQALGLDDVKDLNSYESLKLAIEKNYPEELAQKILDSFAQNKQVQDIGVPDDLRSQAVNSESLADRNYNRIVELIRGI